MSCLLYSEPLAAAAQCEQRNACLVDPTAGNLPTYNTFNASPSSTILPKLSNMSVERDRQLWSMCAGPLLQQKRRGPKGCKRPGEYWVQKGSFKHELMFALLLSINRSQATASVHACSQYHMRALMKGGSCHGQRMALCWRTPAFAYRLHTPCMIMNFEIHHSGSRLLSVCFSFVVVPSLAVLVRPRSHDISGHMQTLDRTYSRERLLNCRPRSLHMNFVA